MDSCVASNRDADTSQVPSASKSCVYVLQSAAVSGSTATRCAGSAGRTSIRSGKVLRPARSAAAAPRRQRSGSSMRSYVNVPPAPPSVSLNLHGLPRHLSRLPGRCRFTEALSTNTRWRSPQAPVATRLADGTVGHRSVVMCTEQWGCSGKCACLVGSRGLGVGAASAVCAMEVLLAELRVAETSAEIAIMSTTYWRGCVTLLDTRTAMGLASHGPVARCVGVPDTAGAGLGAACAGYCLPGCCLLFPLLLLAVVRVRCFGLVGMFPCCSLFSRRCPPRRRCPCGTH